ncbi:MAG: Jag N-terminal domain-containing protein, partial [Armatimonadetes bacterium]|nr:Jag N-terminal domain-containing protein [Armatimonadota bacterium]
MRSVEISASSLEEARRAAAFQLGAAEEEIEIEVLEEPRKLFGIIGSGEYRVRATYDEGAVEPAAPEAEAEMSAGEAGPQLAEAEPPSEPILGRQPPPPVTKQPDDPKQAVADRARQLTEDIVTMIGIDVPVTISSVAEEEVEIQMEGDDSLGLLIGQEGNTLDALQLIVAIGANKGIEDGCRVILDTSGGYRERHREHLCGHARQAAEEAQATGRDIVLTDLKSY